MILKTANTGRARVVAIGLALLASIVGVSVVAPPGAATAVTTQFKGVNWADPNDNYSTGTVVPSGLSTSDSYAVTKQKATSIIAGFANLGANTVRLPINPSSVGTTWWNSYTGAIDAATAAGFKVVLGYWEQPTKDGKIDDMTAWNAMWTTVVAKYSSNTLVYYEPMNEPFGYSASAWDSIVETWLARYPSVAAGNVFVGGTGFSRDFSTTCADAKLAGTILDIHDYPFFGTKTYSGWVSDLTAAAGNCASRSVLGEFGSPLTTGINYDGSSTSASQASAVNNEIAFFQAMTNTVRTLGMGSIVWPGLRTGDTYSLTTLAGSDTSPTLSLTNTSALARIHDGWGQNRSQLVGSGSGRCLDVVAASTSSGASVDIYDCNGGTNQLWRAGTSGQLQTSSLCLDAVGGGTTSGTRVDVATCNGGANQQWSLNSSGAIVGKQSGLCLDVTSQATGNGASIELYTCNGGANQQWAWR